MTISISQLIATAPSGTVLTTDGIEIQRGATSKGGLISDLIAGIQGTTALKVAPGNAPVNETSGPTALVTGAIADAGLLQRVGSTLVAATALVLAASSALVLTLGSQTSGTGANLAITDSTRTGGAGVSQLGVTISHTLNQTSTAAFTSLQVSQVVTAAGSGAQLLFNGLAGAAGTTSVFQVTSTGLALVGNGAVGAPSLAPLASPTDGIYFTAGNVLTAIAGAAIVATSAIGMTLTSGKRIESSAGGVVIAGGQYTSTANGPWAFQNQQVFNGSSVYQTGVRIIAGVNQTSTAQFAALKFEMGLTTAGTGGAAVYGSGGGFIIDALANGTQVFAVTSAGAVQATGSITFPAFSTPGDTGTGFYRIAAGSTAWVTAGAAYVVFKAGGIAINNSGNGGLVTYAGGSLLIGGANTTTATPQTILASYSNTFNQVSLTGAAGILQVGTSIQHTLNQTSTAGFTALDLAITETAPGSGAQYLINAKAGASGTTQVFAVKSTGQVLATGLVGTPAYSFAAYTTTGLYANSATSVAMAMSGALTHSFGTNLFGGNVNGDFFVYNGSSGASARCMLYCSAQGSNSYSIAPVAVGNGTLWSGSSVEQKMFGIYPGVAQTSTAAFIGLDINATGTILGGGSTSPTFGSGGGYAIKVRTGGTSPAENFSVNFSGGIANATTTVTLGAGSTDNSTALGAYGVIEVTSNGAGSTLTGIVAPTEGRYLLIRHVAGLTLTLTHQTVSTAANQFFNGSGATTIVLGIGGQAWYRYSLSAARWCLISYTL